MESKECSHKAIAERFKNIFRKINSVNSYFSLKDNTSNIRRVNMECMILIFIGLVTKILVYDYKIFRIWDFLFYLKNILYLLIIYIIFLHMFILIRKKCRKKNPDKYFSYFLYCFISLLLSPCWTYSYLTSRADLDNFTKGFLICASQRIAWNIIKHININFYIKLLSHLFFILIHIYFFHGLNSEFRSWFISYSIGNIILEYKLQEQSYEREKALDEAQKEYILLQKILDNNPIPTFVYSKEETFQHLNNSLLLMKTSFKCQSMEDLTQSIYDSNKNSLLHSLKSTNYLDSEQEYFLLSNNNEILKRYMCSFKNVYISGKDYFLKIVSLQNMTSIIHKKIGELSEKFYQIIMYSVSHEINSQLNIIKGCLCLIGQCSKLKTIGDAKCALRILRSNIQLIKDFTEFNTNNLVFNFIDFSPKTIVRKLVKIALNIIPKTNKIVIKSTVVKNIPSLIRGDYFRILSILIHVLCNAVKYTSEGQIKISCEYIKEDQIIIYEISDTGIGMNSRLNFDLQIGSNFLDDPLISPNKEKPKFLTGIGLYISSKICELMGGKLVIDSLPLKGTRIGLNIKCPCSSLEVFSVEDDSCLTRNESQDYYVEDIVNKYTMPNKLVKFHEKNNLQNRLKMNEMNNQINHIDREILIVDDMEFNRDVIINMLKMIGQYIIHEAQNGLTGSNKAIEILKRFPNLIIFMDIDMPIMNGIDASSIIRSAKIGNPIIVAVTAFENDQIREKCFKVGINEFLPKPISFKQIKNILIKYWEIES